MGGLWPLAARSTYSEESGLRRRINGEEGNQIGSKMKPAGRGRMEVQIQWPGFQQGKVHWEKLWWGFICLGRVRFLKRL